MKTLQVELTDRLAEEVNKLVAEGWFRDANEITRRALADFLRGSLGLVIQLHRSGLLEQRVALELIDRIVVTSLRVSSRVIARARAAITDGS